MVPLVLQFRNARIPERRTARNFGPRDHARTAKLVGVLDERVVWQRRVGLRSGDSRVRSGLCLQSRSRGPRTHSILVFAFDEPRGDGQALVDVRAGRVVAAVGPLRVKVDKERVDLRLGQTTCLPFAVGGKRVRETKDGRSQVEEGQRAYRIFS